MAKAAAKPTRKRKPKAKAQTRFGLTPSFDAQKAAGIGEERLLAYVAFACFSGFLSVLPRVVRTGEAMAEDDATIMLVSGQFVGFVIFGPLFFYGVAGLVHWIAATFFGGKGSYFDARLALFWSLALGVPLMVLQAIISAGATAIGMAWLPPYTGLGIGAIWLWIWTSLLAHAEGYSRIATFGFALLIVFCITGLAILGQA